MKTILEEIFDVTFTDTRDNYRSLCPFHLESTPSFYVHKDDLVGHCFGCGIAGRLDILVARYLGIIPQRARERLGLKTLPWLDSLGNEKPPPEPTFPQTWIRAWKRITNHPYLANRGLSDEIVEHFEMRWDPSTKRVVWPLQLESGRVVGAVGRSTTGQDPKYLFYWNCDKGQSVWTAHPFYSAGYNQVIVVEGILDCMWMWQNDLRNSVALIGAQATKDQVRQLKEYDNVVIALDNDKAGQIGALSLGQALSTSCAVEYAIYPTYAKDANDLGYEELHNMFTNTITPLEMKLHANI